jgi:hypothetical protein
MRFRSRACHALGVVLLLGSVLGCAVAADDTDGVMPLKKKDAGSTIDSGTEEDDGSTAEDTGSTTEDTGSTKDTGTVDTGSPPEDTGPTDTPCTALTSADCASSFTDLGTVSGDTGSGTKTASGSDSKFFHILVTEDDSSLWSGVDLRLRVTLSPSKGHFDLYVYQGKTEGDGGGVECTSVQSSSTNPSGDDLVSLKWTDNRPIGGSSDTRVISIEVRATDAVCTDASWSLLVEGNK